MKRFTITSEGYNVDEVNRFIDVVIKRLEKLNNEKIDVIGFDIDLIFDYTLLITQYNYFNDISELIKKYGIYSNDNINGVARDHIVSISYGWENNIPSEIISPPANCQIVQQIDNCRKSSGSSISVEELKERIRLWEEGLPLPDISIIGVGNRTKYRSVQESLCIKYIINLFIST